MHNFMVNVSAPFTSVIFTLLAINAYNLREINHIPL